jgi:hypothetical protein
VKDIGNTPSFTFVPGVSQLEELGCKKIEAVDTYHSLWVVIETDIAFSVPQFEGDKCPEVMWPDVLASVSKAKIKN